jgi:hypothetical protein
MKYLINLLAAGVFLAVVANGFGQAPFAKVTEGEIVTDLGQFASAAWGDFSNRGLLDLIATTNDRGLRKNFTIFERNAFFKPCYPRR